ncbi:glutamyl-tRNA(Gln) amidotransferase subunit C, chloroplastic/mitochondrial [Gastrolobium bilobum]|uniref:glutamyl-tRNA(Gln) amidotransferase subunit C, chloroplastic/mitochondrial n=1 Tax=Gastrolobium bilobum TaxID=150636 RepID=UPI002AAF0D29|nr:glutamyl-tRNA(Gln) amidotransferase subunit C, chloroplastic/mitochondrial [Gastrolobium bilobum]
MGSKGLLKGASLSSYSYANAMWHRNSCFSFSFPKVTVSIQQKLLKFRRLSSTTTVSSLETPDVSRLAKTAQISLTPNEVEEFAPKIQQVVDWFGQLQCVDLQSIEPSIRAETENNLRDNAPETFDHRDAMIASVPSYEEPYIKVPRVLSMD